MLPDYSALATDFYVNLRLNVKMDLPTNRETVLGLFDRLRREFPSMNRFRRLTSELVLESEAPAPHDADDEHDDPTFNPTDLGLGPTGRSRRAGDGAAAGHMWAALRKRAIRCGTLNPSADGPRADPYKLHKALLELAPYFLSISPLDVDFVEIMFGLDLLAPGNHDAIVYDALLAGSPLGRLLDPHGDQGRSGGGGRSGGVPLDCQPLLGLGLSQTPDIQAYVEIKTRSGRRAGPGGGARLSMFDAAPLSVYLTVRHYGPADDLAHIQAMFKKATACAEDVLAHRVVPNLVTPLREAIAAAGGSSEGDESSGEDPTGDDSTGGRGPERR